MNPIRYLPEKRKKEFVNLLLIITIIGDIISRNDYHLIVYYFLTEMIRKQLVRGK